MKPFLTLTILTLSIQASFAQSPFNHSEEQERFARSIQNVKEAAKSLAKLDTSCESSSDCVVMGLGKKACGGVSGFLVASKKNQHFSDITYLANRSVVLEKEYNALYSVISDCSMRMPPAIDCSLNRCVQLGVSY